MTLASPKGGQPPLDPKSNDPTAQTDATRRFDADAAARLNSRRRASWPTCPWTTTTPCYPGGHGPLWDLAEDLHSIGLIERALAAGKPVAAVCHAPGVLRHVKNPQTGESVVRGKRVTGFTNSEEAAVELTEVVPFLVEDMLKTNGAEFERSADWAPHVVTDGC